MHPTGLFKKMGSKDLDRSQNIIRLVDIGK